MVLEEGNNSVCVLHRLVTRTYRENCRSRRDVLEIGQQVNDGVLVYFVDAPWRFSSIGERNTKSMRTVTFTDRSKRMNRYVHYSVDISLRFFLSLSFGLCFAFDCDDRRFVETRMRITDDSEGRFSESSVYEELFANSRRTYRQSFLAVFSSINKEIDRLDITIRSFVPTFSKE